MTFTNRLVFLCVMLALTGCEPSATPPSTTTAEPFSGSVSVPLAQFHNVQIDGSVDVSFAEDSTYHVTVRGDETVIHHTTTVVKGDLLIIKANATQTTPVAVTIYSPAIGNLAITHANQINLENLSPAHLVVKADSGHINVVNAFGNSSEYILTGHASLYGNCVNTDQLIVRASGQSQATLQCVTTKHLVLQGEDSAALNVAGQAHQLDVTLSGHATLNSKEITAGKVQIHNEGAAYTKLTHLNVGLMVINNGGKTQTILKGKLVHLDAKLRNSAQLDLKDAQVKSLKTDTADYTVLELRHLKFSHYILIARNHSSVLLTGKVRRLDATLWDFAKLDSICLRTNTLFIATADHAEARVRNDHGLSAFAKQRSTIYYYQDPEMVAEYLRTSGSVLRMKGLVNPVC